MELLEVPFNVSAIGCQMSDCDKIPETSRTRRSLLTTSPTESENISNKKWNFKSVSINKITILFLLINSNVMDNSSVILRH